MTVTEKLMQDVCNLSWQIFQSYSKLVNTVSDARYCLSQVRTMSALQQEKDKEAPARAKPSDQEITSSNCLAALPAMGLVRKIHGLKAAPIKVSIERQQEDKSALIRACLYAKKEETLQFQVDASRKSPRSGGRMKSVKEEPRKPETSSRRRSLPPLKMLERASSSLRARGVRRISGLATFIEEKLSDGRKLPPVFNENTMAKNLEVNNGVLVVNDSFEIDWIPKGEPVTTLIYGENYTGGNRGTQDEIPAVLEKTPKLQCLEFRGCWDFSGHPVNLFDYLGRLPRLENLTKLVLPKNGRGLHKIGNILVGKYGDKLLSLECDETLFEQSCPEDLSLIAPKLQNLKISEISSQVMCNLQKVSWKLEELVLGELHRSAKPGIAWSLLETVVCKFGENLIKFEYSFPVVDLEGSVVDDSDVEIILKKYMLL